MNTPIPVDSVVESIKEFMSLTKEECQDLKSNLVTLRTLIHEMRESDSDVGGEVSDRLTLYILNYLSGGRLV